VIRRNQDVKYKGGLVEDWSPAVRGRLARQELVRRSSVAGKAKSEPETSHPRPGRNDLCPCGSGAKFKRCCLGKEAT